MGQTRALDNVKKGEAILVHAQWVNSTHSFHKKNEGF